MSHETYNELWTEAQRILEETTYNDNIQISSKPSKDKTSMHKQISVNYIKYVIAINKLSECYDQIVHPQKRPLIRKILDASIIRYLELKHELVNLVMSEFTYLDDAVEELGLIPHDIELQIPECYIRERKEDIEWKEKFINGTLLKMGYRETEIQGIQMTKEEAILLIQRHERARQYRMRAQFMKNIREMKDRTKDRPEEIFDIGRKSAIKIQRTWRGFITRRKIQKRVLDEMLLIGMLQPDIYTTEERKKANKLKQSKYEVQKRYEKEYQEALIKEKESIKKYRSNAIMEQIRDEIRKWYLMYKQQTGKFPSIPSEEHGGSRVVIGRQSPLPGSSEGSRSTAGASSDSKSSQSKKSSESQEEKRRKSSDDDYLGFKIGISNVLADLDAANAEYEEIWKGLDESENPNQTYVPEMVRAQQTAEVEAELRKIVDVQLRTELETLQAALERDEKGKRIKKPSKKKKARRSGKKSKKKKDKDLTPDRTRESLFDELIVNGIIRKYPKTSISSFSGDTSCVGYKYQSQGKNITPSSGDIRQVVKEYCILPMCHVNIHQTAPVVKSLLIAGPKDSGKDMLVHAICSEIGAVLFDISAANIVGKYPGKAGLVMLIHLVNKVSKLLQPVIIYIDDAEKTFIKKVPKTDKTDPKRLKKDLPKIVKSIGPTDLVMLIGVTHAPWDCDQKSLTQTYNKIIMMLRPDYASVNSLWSDLLLKYNAFNREISLCILTKLCDGYTVGTLIKAMQRLMTCKRMLRLKIQPLRLSEILEVLSQFEPVYKEEEEAFLQWYAKTPLGRIKQKSLESEMDQTQTGNESNKKKKKKKVTLIKEVPYQSHEAAPMKPVPVPIHNF